VVSAGEKARGARLRFWMAQAGAALTLAAFGGTLLGCMFLGRQAI
jgi:hypothetical protein